MVHGGNLDGGTRPGAAGIPERATRPSLNSALYWSGVAATAVVAAVTAVVGVIIAEGILDRELVPPLLNVFALDGHIARYACSAAVAAVLAGALLHLLILSAPHPGGFFTWIAALVTLACALLPFTFTDNVGDALLTGVLNAAIGISITTLVPAVAVRTRRHVRFGRP
jgi:hypothetical protein